MAVLGEAGLIAWSTTVYYTGAAPSGWEDARFVTGQPYTITAVLTDDGAAVVDAPELLVHRLRTAADDDAGTVELEGGVSSAGIPSVVATPADSGTLYLEAASSTGVVDVVALTVSAGRVQVDDGLVYGVDADGRW